MSEASLPAFILVLCLYLPQPSASFAGMAFRLHPDPDRAFDVEAGFSQQWWQRAVGFRGSHQDLSSASDGALAPAGHGPANHANGLEFDTNSALARKIGMIRKGAAAKS